MKRVLAIIAGALGLTGTVLAGTQTYDVAAFESVSVSAGIEADISIGSARSVVAETRADSFDDLQILVENNVLRVGRPGNHWKIGHRPDFKVHIVAPALRSLEVSSGSDVTTKGIAGGDFTVRASSGSDVDVAGSCVSLEATASSGSDLDADDLQCENVTVHASSGSDVSVHAKNQVSVKASSGSDIKVRGKPPVVNVDKSSGADVTVRD